MRKKTQSNHIKTKAKCNANSFLPLFIYERVFKRNKKIMFQLENESTAATERERERERKKRTVFEVFDEKKRKQRNGQLHE